MKTVEEKELLLQQIMQGTYILQCKAGDVFITAQELREKCQKLVEKEPKDEENCLN